MTKREEKSNTVSMFIVNLSINTYIFTDTLYVIHVVLITLQQNTWKQKNDKFLISSLVATYHYDYHSMKFRGFFLGAISCWPFFCVFCL